VVKREADGVWLTLKETIAAPAEEVFACFATAEGLTRWLAVGAEFEPPSDGRRGSITLAWDRSFTHTVTVAIREFLPPGRIGFEWYPDPLDERSVPVSVVVTAEVSGGCRVILREGPFASDADSLVALADAAESWRWYLCNLRCVLETRHDLRAVRPL
jgi:uncharacterized protein YndB with AHSA1/START domain